MIAYSQLVTPHFFSGLPATALVLAAAVASATAHHLSIPVAFRIFTRSKIRPMIHRLYPQTNKPICYVSIIAQPKSPSTKMLGVSFFSGCSPHQGLTRRFPPLNARRKTPHVFVSQHLQRHHPHCAAIAAAAIQNSGAILGNYVKILG